MELNIKESILDTAIRLFNEKGLGNTSIRHIAEALHISDGNLRYHFKTKEELLLAIYHEFEKEIASFQGGLTSLTWEQMAAALKQSFKGIYKYRFFYLDDRAVSAYLPVKEKFTALTHQRSQLFKAAFDYFKKQGVFHDKIEQEWINIYYRQFLMIVENWVRNIDKKKELSRQMDHYVALALAVLIPCFAGHHQKAVKAWVYQHSIR